MRILLGVFLMFAVGCAAPAPEQSGESDSVVDPTPAWQRVPPPEGLDLSRKLTAGFLIVDGV